MAEDQTKANLWKLFLLIASDNSLRQPLGPDRVYSQECLTIQKQRQDKCHCPKTFELSIKNILSGDGYRPSGLAI